MLAVPGFLRGSSAAASPPASEGLRVGPNVYQSIGVRPLINCRGTLTIVGGSLELPEFSNPAGQLSRVLFFAAVMYGFKAVHDGQRMKEAQPIAHHRAA